MNTNLHTYFSVCSWWMDQEQSWGRGLLKKTELQQFWEIKFCLSLREFRINWEMVALMVTKVRAQLWWPLGFFHSDFHCLRIVTDGKGLPQSPYHLNLDTNNQDISKELTTKVIPCLNFGFLLTPLNSITTKKPHKINMQYLSRMKNLIANSETKTQTLLLVFSKIFFLCVFQNP